MKKLFISLLALAAGLTASAEVVSRNEAEAAAKKYFSSSSVEMVWDGTDAATKASISEPAFYAFNNPAGGWVIIAGDNCAEPVIASSETGYFNAESMPYNMAAWMRGIEKNINAVRKAKLSPRAEMRSKWASIGEKTKAYGTTKLLKTASWGQDSPYNDKCPTYSGSKKSATGCVATAMAIVLRYNKWPEQGKGTIPAYTTEEKKLNIPAKNIDGYKYNWDNMPLTYGSSATTAQKSAVADLMSHLGAMVKMDYDESSGAMSSDIVPALSTYMSYSASAVELYRPSFTSMEWYNMIKAEIDADRPILYGGSDLGDQGGHQFVCDGYDNNGKIHINWGWDGNDEGWFAVNYLGDSQVGYVFSYYDSAIFGLVPDKSGTSKDGIDIYIGSNDTVKEAGIMLASGTISKGSTFNLDVKYVLNDYGSAYSGNCRFALMDRDGQFKEYISPAAALKVPAASSNYSGSTSLSGVSCKINGDIKFGDYIALWYTDVNGNWLRMPGWNIKDNLEPDYTSFCVDRLGAYDIAFINYPADLKVGNVLYFDLIPGQRLISDVTWYYDNVKNDKGHITVSSGSHTIKAEIKYRDGGTETIQTVIKK